MTHSHPAHPGSVHLGSNRTGGAACIDLPELLATRLLVQGNSGSGKSHLLRRLLEQTAHLVQQVIIDPEGDFVTLAEKYAHLVIDAETQTESGLQAAGERVRLHRAPIVLNLEHAEPERQLRAVGAFLSGMFETPRSAWYPVLVVVDEAQLFAPSAGGDTSDEARRLSLNAMTNLMCRGRKRGMAGIIATQRLAKLAKNVAAEASNFLMGRTFLDIDMARAADLLGMERRAAESFRDLARGQFMALGPALCRRPQTITIGPVETASHAGGPLLMPLEQPDLTPETLRELILQPVALQTGMGAITGTVSRPRREPAPIPPDLIAQLDAYGAERQERQQEDVPEQPEDPEAHAALLWQIVQEVAAPDHYSQTHKEARLRPLAALYQDFQARARMRELPRHVLDLPGFRQLLDRVRCGIDSERAASATWQEIEQRAARLPEDLQSVYLTLARKAWDCEPCPDDEALARLYGTSSRSRARRQLAYLEECEAIVLMETGHTRRIAIIGTDWVTT